MSENDRAKPLWVGLPRPIPAQLSGVPVSVLDAAPDAVLIEHLREFGNATMKLEFLWQKQPVALVIRDGRVVEEFWDMTAKGNIYASEFRVIGQSPEFQQLLDRLNESIERAQQANLLGENDANLIEGTASIADIGAARRERLTSFVAWHLEQGDWRREPTTSPDQPAEGFTVAAHESEEQVELLRLAYQEADAEGRKMIREFAALAIEPWR